MNNLGRRSLVVLWGLCIGYLLVGTSPLTKNYSPVQLPRSLLYSALFLSGIYIGARFGEFKDVAKVLLVTCLVASLVMFCVLAAPILSPYVVDKEPFIGTALLEALVAFGLLLAIQFVGGVVGTIIGTSSWFPWSRE